MHEHTDPAEHPSENFTICRPEGCHIVCEFAFKETKIKSLFSVLGHILSTLNTVVP